MQEHVEHIDRSLDRETMETFQRRVTEQVRFLTQSLHDRELDNDDFTIGLELEAYAVDDDGFIAPLSDDLLADAPFNPELGLHNAELNTDPAKFSANGITQQYENLQQQFDAANTHLEEHGYQLVLDAIWTLHSGESFNFLSVYDEVGDYTFPSYMRNADRYHAMDNAFLTLMEGEIPFNVPGADHIFPSILFECLATSIQPHLQVPDADAFAPYYNTASRTMAPVLALATNSPFLPPDLYNEVDEPTQLVEDTYHELRIPIFEQAVNRSQEYNEMKVRFPLDVQRTEELVNLVGDDETYAPALQEWDGGEDGFLSEFWEWNYKRKTFWRWVRPVISGRPVEGACDERSIRLEYRPLPTQPSIKDIVAFQALTTGLIHGLRISDHPINELDWDAAKNSFYNVVENGLAAEMHWVNEDGEHTTDKEKIFEEVFRYAREGLTARDMPEETQDTFLTPLEERWKKRVTPSIWKKERVRAALADGDSLEDAIHGMQREYIRMARAHDEFADWL